jgi:cob(I)alamin adenosyltransferase
MIYILTGNGKGKTTSSIGMGVRAAGAGKKIFMIQFLKSGKSSEVKVVKKIKNFYIKSFGQNFFVLPQNQLNKHPKLKKFGIKPISEKDFELAEEALVFAEDLAGKKKCDFLILDEIFLALYFKLIDKERVLKFLKKFKNKIDIILTGRRCPREFLKIADLVTECRQIKHYYKKLQKDKKTRKGLEY